MAEISTVENERLVGEVYTRTMGRVHSGKEITEAERIVWEIEGLSQEVNSGASYEQYFRWRPVSEIAVIVRRLDHIGLPEVAALTQQAIDVAFPDGIPETDLAKSYCTNWSEDQDRRLMKLGDQFTEFNGRIMNILAEFYRKAAACE
jgi:hypothetical protein